MSDRNRLSGIRSGHGDNHERVEKHEGSLEPDEDTQEANAHLALAGYVVDHNSCSQRGTDSITKSLPSDVSMTPELQKIITAYIEGTLSSSPPEVKAAGLVEASINSSVKTGAISAHASTTSNGLAVASSIASASAPAPVLLGAAAVTATGAIGMAAASVWRLFLIGLPKLASGKKRDYAETQNKLLATITDLNAAQEEAARKANDLETLKRINLRHVDDLEDFRRKLDDDQGSRYADYQELEKKDKKIKSLKKKLKELRMKPRESEHSPETFEMLRLEQSRVKREQEARDTLASAMRKSQAAEESSSCLRVDLLSARSKLESQHSEIQALKQSLADTQRERDEVSEKNSCCRCGEQPEDGDHPGEDTSGMCDHSRSAIRTLETSLADMRRECNEMTERVKNCRCGGQPDLEASRIDERARSAIQALHTELNFHDQNMDFLDSFDHTRPIDAVVRTLCGRLGNLIPTVYRDRSLAEQQNAQATKEIGILRAALKKATKEFPVMQDKLCDALLKNARLEHELSVSEAKRKLAEASGCSRRHAEGPAQKKTWLYILGLSE